MARIFRIIQILLFVVTPYFIWGQNHLSPFIKNQGQWRNTLLYRSLNATTDIWIESNKINLYFLNQAQVAQAMQHPANQNKSNLSQQAIDGWALQYKFLNAKTAVITEQQQTNTYYNFFLGNNRSNWAAKVGACKNLTFNSIYHGINLNLNIGKELKYEFWVEPNAKVEDIKIEITGATKIYTTYEDLFVETPLITIKESKPYAYQLIHGIPRQVEVNFGVDGNVIYFKPSSDYNPQFPLIIDPNLVFLTYSGSTVDNFGFTATPGESGNLYAGGISTFAYSIQPSGTYPVQSGSFRINFNGGCNDASTETVGFACDITLSKYSSDGTSLLWSTYMGGGCNEYPHSLYVDNDSNLLVLGTTNSSDFPVTSNAYDTSYNGNLDIVVFKFNKDGSQLLGSTYIGDTANDGLNLNGVTNYFYADGFRGDITSNLQNEIFIASVTQSLAFPVSAAALKTNLGGAQDGVICKLNQDLSSLLWSTYFGGSGVDALYSIDVGEDSKLYLAGGTSSTDLPATAGSVQQNYNGGRADGFITIISDNGQSVVNSTYWGSNAYDQIFSLEIDENKNIYVVGHSTGVMPVIGQVYKNNNSRQFISCINNSLDLTRWSTVFGSGRTNIDLTINAFLVDECGRIYVSGWGGSVSGTNNSFTNNLPITNDAFQKNTDGSDFYLMMLNRDAKSLLYATFLGGNQNTGDHVDGGTSRFDKKGVVYQSMCASCPNGVPPTPLSDLNTTPNSFAPVNLSPRCSNAALKFDFRIQKAAFDYTIDTCAGIFKFKNKTPDAFNFYWIFPDGDTSTAENPEKLIAPKYYGDTITLIVEFGTNCADTAYGTVILPDTNLTLFVPNVFTPNGDNLNDYFKLGGGVGNCDLVEVFIYNRWGQLMYESKSRNFAWDGNTPDGNPALEGVYFVILNINKQSGEHIKQRSTLTLIK